MKKTKVLFLLSVDTEEEFDWNGEFPQSECSVQNINQLPHFHDFCTSLGVRPTYLVDYPVATISKSIEVLNQINALGNAEIGGHLHPWCTPPFEGSNGEYDSHVINLPASLMQAKLENLTRAIEENIGVSPRAFRTGRWGINSATMRAIGDQGYSTDSSIYPFYANEYFSCKDAPHLSYWPDLNNPHKQGSQRNLLELPVTSGFSRPNFKKWSKLHDTLSSPLLKPLRLIGLAWKLNLLKKIYLSPELADTKTLLQLAEACIQEKHPYLHMYIHSSTLLPGFNVFTKNGNDTQEIYDRIAAVINHLKENYTVEFVTISEAHKKLGSSSMAN